MVNWPILSLTSFALLLLSTLLLTTGWSSYFLFAAPLLVTSVLLLSTSLYLESDTYYRDTHKDRPFTKKEILSLLGIVCIGMILRLQDLHIFPYPYGVLSIEEAQGGSLSSKVYEGTSYPWEFIVEYCLGALGMSIWRSYADSVSYTCQTVSIASCSFLLFRSSRGISLGIILC